MPWYVVCSLESLDLLKISDKWALIWYSDYILTNWYRSCHRVLLDQMNIPQADFVKEESGWVRKRRKIGQIPGAPFSGNAGKLKGRRITGVHSAQLHGDCGEHCRLCRLLQICGEHWCILVHSARYPVRNYQELCVEDWFQALLRLQILSC